MSETNIPETKVEGVNEEEKTSQESTNVQPSESNDADVNIRLLEESKAWKAKAKYWEKQLKEREDKEKQDQGKWQELFQTTKSENEKLSEMLLEQGVKIAVYQKATDCVDLDALISLGDKTFLAVDDDSGKITGVDEFLQNARNQKPYLFQGPGMPKVNTTSPQFQPEPKLTTEYMLALEKTDYPKYKDLYPVYLKQRKKEIRDG